MRDTAAGQAVYTRRVLRLYDPFVLGFSNRFLWRCPTRHLSALYERDLTANHLEIGVGTGYFLDRAAFPSAAPRLVLFDLNPTCLAVAAHRVARHRPETVAGDALEPLPDMAPFDSIALNYVLHCLPGALRRKARVFDHAAARLTPGGVVFGATILGRGTQQSPLARRLMATYQRKRIFDNAADDEATLRRELTSRFADVEVDVIGCVARFRASGRRPGAAQSASKG